MSMMKLKEIITRRQATFDYIKRSLANNINYLNIVKLTDEDILKSVSQLKCEQLFMLGYSLGKLMECNNGALSVQAYGQLMEEYEYFISPLISQNMKFLGSKSVAEKTAASNNNREHASSHHRKISEFDSYHADTFKPALISSGKKVLFSQLQTPKLFIIMDFVFVVKALCDIASLFYLKIQDQSAIKPLVYECFLRADNQLHSNVLEPLITSLNNISLNSAVSREFKSIAKMFAEQNENGENKSLINAFDLNEDQDFEDLIR